MQYLMTILLAAMRRHDQRSEAGMTTAELLANAALAVAALVAIWAALTTIGSGITNWISAQLPG
ncbi:MAG: hypothetical protein ACOYN3_02900 [Acidimicrobiia bacterium]